MNNDEMIVKWILEKLKTADFEKGSVCPASRECECNCDECGGLISRYELYRLLGLAEGL